jgi:hypothetical protein
MFLQQSGQYEGSWNIEWVNTYPPILRTFTPSNL